MQNIVIFAFIILFYYRVPLSSAEISPCARWNQQGKTVAGRGIAGDALSQLSMPKGIFIVKKTNTLYVADFGNQRVQKFSLAGPLSWGTTVASNINSPSKIYVDDDDKDGPTIYIAVFIGNRVEKWTKGASKGIQLVDECRSCFGIAVDTDKNVYMSESDRHRVVKWSPQTNSTTVVAGQTDERGFTDEYLSAPDGLYFDTSSDALYVADSGNGRIQKWEKNALSGIRVAGSNFTDWSHDDEKLDEPNGVWVDQQTKVVYVADTLHNRIVRWLPGASMGDVIAGGKGSGDAANQFNTPSDLSFDDQGNLYVCDNWNHRIQMFSIIDNKPCSPTSTGTRQASCLLCNRYNKWAMIITVLPVLTWIVRELSSYSK